MPNYKGHLVGGAVSYVIGMFLIHPWIRPSIPFAFELFVFAMAGSLFPDVDIKSKGQKWFYRIIGLLMLFLLIKEEYASCAFIALAALLPLLVNHRGLFHQWWFIIICSVIAPLYARLYIVQYATLISLQALFFMIGAMSHLWLDLGIKGLIRQTIK